MRGGGEGEGRSDTHCKIKETLLIQELKPTLNDNVLVCIFCMQISFFLSFCH